MKKYAIAIVFLLWLGVFAFGGRGRYSSTIWRRVQGGIEYTGGDVTVTNGVLVSSGGVGDLIPDVNNTYDLGSSTKLWKELYLTGSSLHIGRYTLKQDVDDDDGLELDGALHTAVVAGKSGNLCIHEGNEPTASNSATGNRLWTDLNGVLMHQKSSNAGGGSRAVIVDDGSGNVGIGTDSPDNKLHVLSISGNPGNFERSSATTNTSLRCSELERKTTGTAANGIGAEMAFKVEDDGGGTETAGAIGVTLTDVSAESEEGAMIFEVVSDSSLVEGMRIQGVPGGSANIVIPGDITVTEDFYIYDAARSRVSVQSDGTYLFNPAGGRWFGMKDDGNSSKGNIYPSTDNTYDLGTSSLRWDDVWATNGTIQTSDERRKKDIADLNYGIDEINQLRPVSFKWNKSKDNRTKLGLIAQEIVDILPEVVYGSEEESYGINYGDLVPILIKAIQEQQKQIDELAERIERLENGR